MNPPSPLMAGIAVAVTFGAFSGCVGYHPRPLSAEAEAGNFGRRTLDDPGLESFAASLLPARPDSWPPESWGLTDLTLAAFYYHPALDVARAQWAQAQARRLIAGERQNPSLNLTPGYNTTLSTPSPWLPLAVLDVPLQTAGKRGHSIARARELTEAARLNIATVAWRVRSRLRESFTALDAATQSRALLKDQSDLQARNVALMERQYDAGAISAFELTQARIAADAARFALNDAERQEAEARVRLASAIGVPAAALEGVTLSFDELDRLPDEASLAGARKQALSNRSDILGALAEYAASEAALQLEIARQYPDIHLLPGYQYDQGEDKWSLGLTLTLPMLNRNRGGIAEASAAREESAARFNLLQSSVLGEIDSAVAGYRAALKSRSDAEDSLDRLQQQEKTARAVFETGEISRSELLGVQLQLGASALTRLDALVKLRQALGKLEDALQSPLGLPPDAWQLAPRSAPQGAARGNPGEGPGKIPNGKDPKEEE
jgi:outer membrane protein, heavy metal efflux system